MIAEKDNKLKIYGLAPICVALRYQHQEIGTKLIEIIIKKARKNNIDTIFILGYPSYYLKFGFKPAREYKIKCEYDVPADVFMVLDLSAKLGQLKGQTVYYAEEFRKVFRCIQIV